MRRATRDKIGRISLIAFSILLIFVGLLNFTSFAQHKAFLRKDPTVLEGCFQDYADRIATTTDWYNSLILRVHNFA
jgi:hypothetical protein